MASDKKNGKHRTTKEVLGSTEGRELVQARVPLFKHSVKGDAISGYFVGTRTVHTKKYDKPIQLHRVVTPEGARDVFGNGFLNNGMKDVAPGTFVSLPWDGEEVSTGKANDAKVIPVLIDPRDSMDPEQLHAARIVLGRSADEKIDPETGEVTRAFA